MIPRRHRFPRPAVRRRGALLVVISVIATLSVPALEPPATAALPSDAIGAAIDEYEIARARLMASESAVSVVAGVRDAAQRSWAAASADASAAAADLSEQRDRYGALSAEYFMQQGTKDGGATGSIRLAMEGGRQVLDRAKASVDIAAEGLEVAEEVLAVRQRDLDRSGEELSGAQAAAAVAGARADDALADAGITDLPAVAYIAYRRAAESAAAAHPDCHVPAAVLAGIGRIASSHGRNLGSSVDDLGRVSPALRGLQGETAVDTDGGAIDGDSGGDRAVGPMQLEPWVWAMFATDANRDGAASPDDIFDAAATTARALCGPGVPLDTFAALDAAVRLLVGDGQQSAVVLGAARRYATAAALDMGAVPADPRVLVGDGTMQFDGEGTTDLVPGDVVGMLLWSLTRLGTPYSQCLGPDVRPQDPPCPPGTNRFGSGFFDCSGFVSHAYRTIGILVPATTYAMEADPSFMATKVSDRIDPAALLPGDVFLMDGHTGMYMGGGMILHAIGRGLTYEPVPGWVANGTFAVLRPLLLL